MAGGGSDHPTFASSIEGCAHAKTMAHPHVHDDATARDRIQRHMTETMLVDVPAALHDVHRRIRRKQAARVALAALTGLMVLGAWV